MMMIQATDDKSLVKVAFAAAQTIEDEKLKPNRYSTLLTRLITLLNSTKLRLAGGDDCRRSAIA